MLFAASISLHISGAQTAPGWVGYQGRLTDSTGVNLPDGTQSVTFRLYSGPVGGSALWSEVKTVSISRGVFSTQLGLLATEGGSPFPTNLFTQRLWLGITVGSGTELVPRQELGASPFALALPPNAVTTSMIANNAITTAKLADGSVTSGKLANDFLSLAKVSGGFLTYDAQGIQTLLNRKIGPVLADGFTYGSSHTGHYSLGWYDNDPDSGYIGVGPVARLSSYGGIKLFTRGVYRVGIHPTGYSIFNGNLYVNSNGFAGDPVIDLAIGDGDTGIDSQGDGTMWIKANGVKTAVIAQNYFEVVGSFINNSSIRYKTNVRTLNRAMDLVNALRPVRYNWKTILNGKADIGFIAEEVAKVVPEITAKDEQGRVEGIDYTRFSALLVRAMQEQEALHKAEQVRLAAKLALMEARLAKLEARSH